MMDCKQALTEAKGDMEQAVVVLRKKGVSKVGGPLDTLDKLFHEVRKCGHGLDAGIPVLFLHCICQDLPFQVRVFH